MPAGMIFKGKKLARASRYEYYIIINGLKWTARDLHVQLVR